VTSIARNGIIRKYKEAGAPYPGRCGSSDPMREAGATSTE
jgi:hypothetical protein